MDTETPPDSADVLETGGHEEKFEEVDDSKLRTIIVDNLRHPGGWSSNRQFQKLLNAACHFNATFSRPTDSDLRQIKIGRVEMVFSTTETARDAYTSLQKLIIDGARPVTLVDAEFFSTPEAYQNRTFFELSDDPRLVFLLDLPKSVDEHMIGHFFGGELPVHFSTLPMPSGENLLQAEVLLANSEVAARILEGPAQFAMSDEDVECVVKLLSPREYSLYSKMDDVQKKPVRGFKRPLAPDSQSQSQLAPEIDEDTIVARLMEIIDEKRLNWAEINEKHELYELCDIVSAAYNGVPDSILKPAMGVVLQRHLNRTTLHWQREHVEGLLRGWKLEIMSEQKFERSTFVPMETIDYRPMPVDEEKKGDSESKSAAKRKKANRARMGVGAFLAANRERLIVETGEMDVDSDDDGNVVIGGEALSFDSWAKITKTKASGVVRANDDGTKKIGNGGLSRKQMRMARAVEGMDQEEWKKWKAEKNHARRTDMKQRIMQRGAVEEGEEVEGAEDVNQTPEVQAPAPEPKKAPKDLDEGEIDSDEEEAAAAPTVAKKRRPSDSSDSSSSSSSEDDPDGPVDARKRRKMRRKMDRKNPRVLATSSAPASLNPEFRAMFENRKAIIAQMSPAHKAAFASALNQIAQNNASAAQTNASQVISSMMSGFK